MPNNKLKICLIEPFYTGSHKKWADEYQYYSKHNIEILSLKGIYWKWRMHGGAITLAEKFNQLYNKKTKPDLILTTDMLNLPVFSSFIKYDIPTITFFHENQLTYPWSSKDRDKLKNRDHHYGFINYSTALKSNAIMFNSLFHLHSFINALKVFLKQFPDHRGISNIEIIKKKSIVSYLGLNLNKFNKYELKQKNKYPIILWNHRWEYDKNPDQFFNSLKKIKEDNYKFNLVVLGEEFQTEMSIFNKARELFADELLHIGYCDSFTDYAKWLWKSDILPITSNQDFFGISIMEAVYCKTIPILPNRLTYPELFKSDRTIFYNNDNELIEKIKASINNLSSYKKLNKLASKFDWTKIAKKYDIIMNNVYYSNIQK